MDEQPKPIREKPTVYMTKGGVMYVRPSEIFESRVGQEEIAKAASIAEALRIGRIRQAICQTAGSP